MSWNSVYQHYLWFWIRWLNLLIFEHQPELLWQHCEILKQTSAPHTLNYCFWLWMWKTTNAAVSNKLILIFLRILFWHALTYNYVSLPILSHRHHHCVGKAIARITVQNIFNGFPHFVFTRTKREFESILNVDSRHLKSWFISVKSVVSIWPGWFWLKLK